MGDEELCPSVLVVRVIGHRLRVIVEDGHFEVGFRSLFNHLDSVDLLSCVSISAWQRRNARSESIRLLSGSCACQSSRLVRCVRSLSSSEAKTEGS